EDDKETAKHRLQRLIRDFAHDAVGPGLPVEVQSADAEGEEGGTLRLDRRLSQIEFWLGGGSAASIVMPFSKVESISKGAEGTDEKESDPRMASALKMVWKAGAELRVTFDSVMARDRAYTCLRIFHMSMEQVGRGAEPKAPA
ncbi:unnamed protein product, partial [Effrenium voratum]